MINMKRITVLLAGDHQIVRESLWALSEDEAEQGELRRMDEQVGRQTRVLTAERTELARLRQADATVAANARGNSKPKGKR